MQERKTLVLCVDRDDDIGYKAQIASPVIGREASLAAAIALALADPEDSDVNAIFQGIRIYDDLVRRGEEVSIAILAGDHTDMIQGDRKIATMLEQVIRTTGQARASSSPTVPRTSSSSPSSSQGSRWPASGG